MPRPRLTPLRKGVLLWLLLLGLHQIPWSTQVMMCLHTERLELTLPSNEVSGLCAGDPSLVERCEKFLAALPLSGFTLYRPADVTLRGATLREQGQQLAVPGSTFRFHAAPQSKAASMHFQGQGEGLQLTHLALTPESTIQMTAAWPPLLTVQVDSPYVSQVALTVGSTFTLEAQDIEISDDQGNVLVPSEARHTLEITLDSSTAMLLFEQAPGAFRFEAELSPVYTTARHCASPKTEQQYIPLGVLERLPVSHLDFVLRRATDGREISKIRYLRIAAAPPETQVYLETLDNVFLKPAAQQVFTLHALYLGPQGLVSELVGTTRHLDVGKEPPLTNRAPSLLQVILNNTLVKVLAALAKLFKTITEFGA